MNEETHRYRITGRVQGVFFRGWTVERATALGLRGWVRNRADGSVEALARGTPDTLAAFEARLRQGPAAARVADVVSEVVDEDVAAGFGQREDG